MPNLPTMPANPEAIDPEGGKMIQARPGFVVKTRDVNGEKVFVNMTMHEVIEAPEQKSLPDMEEMGIRVPLSLGDPREDHDKGRREVQNRG